MGTRFTIPSTPVALSASATKSLILADAGTNELYLREIGIGFDASAAGQSVRVELYRVTTIGTPTGTSTTPIKKEEGTGAADATSLTNLTAEPTAVEVLKVWYVPPNGGELVLQNPLGDEEVQRTATDGRLGLRVVTPTGVTPNAVAYFEIEE